MAAISASLPPVDAWSAGVAAGITPGATPLPPTRPRPPAQPRAPPPAPPAGLSKRTSTPAPPRSSGAWAHVGLSSGASVVGAVCPALEPVAAMPATLGVATDDPWQETDGSLETVPYDPWEETATALAQSSPAPLLSAEDAWDAGEALAAVPPTCGAWTSTGLRAPTTTVPAPPPLLPAADAWDPWEPRATWTASTPSLTASDQSAARGFWCTTAPHATPARPSVAYDPYASYDPWAA